MTGPSKSTGESGRRRRFLERALRALSLSDEESDPSSAQTPQTGHDSTVITGDLSVHTQVNSVSTATDSKPESLPTSTVSKADPGTINPLLDTPFNGLSTLLNNNRVFEDLEDTVKDLCSLRKKSVEGVQNAYENHLSSQQPRDRVQVYEVQVDGLDSQALAIFSTAGNESTFFCFTICPEEMTKRSVSSKLQGLIITLSSGYSLSSKPQDMLMAFERVLESLVAGKDNRTAWALEVGAGNLVLKEVGWGIIQGEGSLRDIATNYDT